MKPLVIVLQFWEGDRDQAMRLARLIADNEDIKRKDVDFMFAARFDCKHDKETVEHVSKVFEVIKFNSRRTDGVGWPHGPNSLWFDAMTWLYEERETRQYEAILCLEADDVPLHKDWLSKLIALRRSFPRKVIFGQVAKPGPHCNGNCLMSGDIDLLKKIARKGGCSPHVGWDMVMASFFKKLGWHDTPLIRSHYAQRTTTPSRLCRLIEQGCVMLHGIKDNSALEFAEDHLLAAVAVE